MKKFIVPCVAAVMSLLGQPAFSQTADTTALADTTGLLGLAGDNLDLYAVLTLFQKSKTIEAFEASLNDEKSKINNLDLNLDKKIDFIKVVTKKDGDAYSFILKVDVTKTETQDVAVILLSKDKNKKVSLQMVGDPDLYGKDYVIEPAGNSSVTPNPGYTGDNPVTVTVPATTTNVVVVESAPIVQYVYSPAYVPYAPPYYYGYYPPYFAFATVMAVGIYRSNHYGYHGGYYGGHYHGGNNNVVINTGNRNSANHYNNSRNTSNTVANNRNNGNYGNGNGNRASAGNLDNNKAGSGNRASNNNLSNNKASANNRASTNNSASNNRVSNNNVPNNRSSSANYSSSGRTRSSSSGGGGGGMRSGGGGGGGRRR
jgi:uncharacterized membrane protein YgcG